MKFFLSILGMSLLLQACWVSRAERPNLTGYIYDMESRKPIAGCKVGESFTDSTGYYKLEEIRYRQFTFIGMEAPSLHVMEIVDKPGYKVDTIKAWNPYGGGIRKGVHWEMDTVFLKIK